MAAVAHHAALLEVRKLATRSVALVIDVEERLSEKRKPSDILDSFFGGGGRGCGGGGAPRGRVRGEKY